MENFFAFAALILMMLLFVGGIQWIIAKFFGAKVFGRFQLHRAMAEIEEDKKELFTHSEPDIEEGIRRCEKKGYIKTHTNVLVEVKQLILEREHRTTSDVLKEGAVYLKKSAADIISRIGRDKYDQLEQLGRLRDKGILTEEEFETEKNRIFK